MHTIQYAPQFVEEIEREQSMFDSTAPLRVDALGSLRVCRGPAVIDPGPAKQRAVFATLVLRAGQTVSIDFLVAAVWGTDQPLSARQIVHTYVARLRRLLEPGLPPRERNNIIASAAGGYRLDLGNEVADVSRFRVLYRRARQQLVAGDPERAFDLLSESMHLWRDPDLTELSTLLRTPEMLDPLRRMWCDAALEYVSAGVDLGRAAAVLPTARRLVEAEPLNETAQARYLLVLAQTGRRAAAIEHFNDIRMVLHAELGVEPGAQLAKAYGRVLNGGAEPAPHRPGDTERLRPPWRGPGPGPGPLVDRKRDLDALARILGERRLLTVTGPPGCGKSVLALQAAARSRDDFPGGVLVLDCAAIAVAAGPGPGLTAALGGAPADPPGRLLAAQHLLLLLDNVEHLVDSTVTVVEDVVRACPGVSVLVTSREPLGLPYETVWRLDTLTAGTSDGVRGQPAVALFARRADQVRPGFRLTEADARHVAGLCRLLDDLPLAVELAAECLVMDTLQELLARMDDPLHELRPRRRGRPEHHRSLLAAFRRSVDCLDPEQRWCFARLGTLPRCFRAPEAAEAWADAPYGPVDARMMLTALAYKSLLDVRHDEYGRTYGMLGLLHRFALELDCTEYEGVTRNGR
jgi:predicted ATPase/DNA-binding SARP family transcriptional activator